MLPQRTEKPTIYRGSITEYREISGFDGYRVGSDGSVWSRLYSIRKNKRGRNGGGFIIKTDGEWRRLKPWVNSQNHYFYVCIRSSDGRAVKTTVHALILKTFIGERPQGMQACHFNGDRQDNRLENLRWDTPKGNSADAIRHGTLARGAQKQSALTESDVCIIRSEAYRAGLYDELSERFPAAKATIIGMRKGWTWKNASGDIDSINHKNKLSPSDIAEIISYPPRFGLGVELSKRFMVSSSTINRIRRKCGAASGRARKLNAGQIREIRLAFLHPRKGLTTELSRRFGVHRKMINLIRNGKSWVHTALDSEM